MKKKDSDLAGQLRQLIVGQNSVIDSIVPSVELHACGLAPEGRPAGIFLLLGPTGTGKTYTVESLAKVLHGSEKKLMRVDCGEFQMEHEVAKLTGAPPGYLGHRETTPMLNQQKLNSVTSEHSDISIILFDEIEKAASSMTRILLAVFDKATLRLGDNTTVNFEKSIIFLTSNLGAEKMQAALDTGFGFEGMIQKSATRGNLENICTQAVKRKFTPEFVNRIDSIVTYEPLSFESLEVILEQQIQALLTHIKNRLGSNSFEILFSPKARKWLLRNGTSRQYGARELKRLLQRKVMQPLAPMISENKIGPGSTVKVDVQNEELRLRACA